MSLKISGVFFVVFFLNVFLSSTGILSVLNDVQELILLSASVLFFVVGILNAETNKNT